MYHKLPFVFNNNRENTSKVQIGIVWQRKLKDQIRLLEEEPTLFAILVFLLFYYSGKTLFTFQELLQQYFMGWENNSTTWCKIR